MKVQASSNSEHYVKDFAAWSQETADSSPTGGRLRGVRTIVVQQQDFARPLEQSPSLSRLVLPANVYTDAKELAAAESGLAGETAFPRECPYTAEEILGSAYWPGE